MKPGARALGVAESYRGTESTFAGVVTRVDRVVDGFAFGRATVGGSDATTVVCDLFSTLAREDVRYVLIAGIAPAWYNILDLFAINDVVDRPVISVAYEESEGLEEPLRREFSDTDLERRLDRYRRQPARHPLVVGDETVFVRAVGLGIEDARDVVRAFTPEGGRPEPLRVARLAARAADRLESDS